VHRFAISAVVGTLVADAFLGFWQFPFQSRNADGSFNAAFPGHWSFENKPGGLLIEDRWRADNSSQPMGVGTYTYRTFHPQRNVWQMLGTSSLGGEFARGYSDRSMTYRRKPLWRVYLS
jgi:hypothetical protein